MNSLEKFANIDKKFAWSFLGFVLAVFFGGLTIYNEFIKVHDPQMVIEILSDTNVLDLKENLPELKILYGDVDIKSIGKDLSIIVFRVKNIGGASILGGYYDEKSPVEITLYRGEFLKFEKIDSSNDYLKDSANAIRISPTNIRLPNVIMEPGESYTLKALIIHGARTDNIIKSSGKIAGMREIPIIKIEANTENESFLSKVISGPITVQIARIPLYFVAFMLTLGAAFLPPIIISEAIQKRARNKSISQFKKHINNTLPDCHEAIFNCYLNHGLPPLVLARKILSDTERLKGELGKKSQAQWSSNKEQFAPFYETDLIEYEGIRHFVGNRAEAAKVIKNAAIATIEQDGSVQVDTSKEQFLGRFIDYITIKES